MFLGRPNQPRAFTFRTGRDWGVVGLARGPCPSLSERKGSRPMIGFADLSRNNPTSETWKRSELYSLGSRTLANVLSQIHYDGAVAACGLAQGPDLPATVIPFILRDVTLAGVNSVWTPRNTREEAWSRLAKDLDLVQLNSMTSRARLDDVRH